MAEPAVSDTKIQECIVECDSCHDLCIETVTDCLVTGGSHAAPGHVTLLLDCAQICQAAADFMLRRSPLHGAICRVGAAVCDACAASCETLGGPDMKACADACRRCASACRAVAGDAA